MYTSYFANWRNYPVDKYQPIGIVRYVPVYFKHFNMIELAPPNHILKRHKNEEEVFRMKYREYLNNNVSAINILVEVAKMAGDKIPVLVCFETPDQFCHRQVLREWLIDERNVNITELSIKAEVQIKLDL